jgi:outer membrane beta-barrel protein
MKTLKYKIFIMILLLANTSFAKKSVSDDLDSLGVNREVIRKARKLSPDNKIQVVQKRAVDRNLRFEGSLGYGFLTGGNPYIESRQLEYSLEFHINPRWSVGGRFYTFDNELSKEGKRVFNDASQNGIGIGPDVRDFSREAYLGTVSFYPLYGKVNLFNWKVTQFDLFLTAGIGRILLDRSGPSELMSVSGGIGFWLTNWLTSRFEVRYQTYNDTIGDNQQRQIDQTVFMAKLGFLL